MATDRFNLKQILAIAKLHPFYNENATYPTSREEAYRIAEEVKKDDSEKIDLTSVPLATKDTLYKPVQRLLNDLSPENNFRVASYVSTTGGGSGGLPLVFATDCQENRRQRAEAGALIRTCRLIEPGDWVLTVHSSGSLYRALDLMTELFEQAGASVLCAGRMPMKDVLETIIFYHVNVISGDGSQMLQLANHIAALPAETREKIRIAKVIYTSEAMSRQQLGLIKSILGAHVKIHSVLGSAEAGPWAVSNLDLTSNSTAGELDADEGVDFIYDSRMMVLEILHSDALDGDVANGQRRVVPKPLPDGEIGVIIQTSLSRLRNPLVRYVTGDLGSLRDFPVDTTIVSAEEAQHLRILRLYGRDRRFSFKYFGEYFSFPMIKKVILSPGWGVLQWQLILSETEELELRLEIRLYRGVKIDGIISEGDVRKELKEFFKIGWTSWEVGKTFEVLFLADMEGFVKSNTGGKVMNFVDLTTKKKQPVAGEK